MSATDVRSAVADATRAIAAAGQSDLVWGHVALRDPNGRGVWMKRSGLGFDEVQEQDVLLVSPKGDVVEGVGARHIEFHVHTGVMNARSDVNAVVHTHSMAASSFASIDVPLRALSHDAVPFLDPDVRRFTLSGDLIATAERGAELAAALGDAPGMLIPGHGLVTAGPTLAAAVMYAALLDRACRIQLDALAAGGPRVWSSDAEVESKRRIWSPGQLEAGYGYLVRQGRKSL